MKASSPRTSMEDTGDDLNNTGSFPNIQIIHDNSCLGEEGGGTFEISLDRDNIMWLQNHHLGLQGVGVS